MIIPFGFVAFGALEIICLASRSMLSLMDYEIICINTLVLARLLTTLPRNPGAFPLRKSKAPFLWLAGDEARALYRIRSCDYITQSALRRAAAALIQ